MYSLPPGGNMQDTMHYSSFHSSRLGRLKSRLLFCLLFFSVVPARPIAAQSISTQYEVLLAEYVRAQIVSSQPLLYGTPYNRIADSVMQNLLSTGTVRQANLPYRWEWFVVNAPGTPNAGTALGGKFIIYSGLAQVLGDDESLWAAVMAHEVSHALYRHPVLLLERAVAYQNLQAEIAQAQSTGAAIGATIGAIGYSLLAEKLSRDEESQADGLGLLLMAEAGYAPDFAMVMHQLMRQKLGDTSNFMALFSDHPRWVTRDARTYQSYAQARALYLGAKAEGRARGGSPPPWAIVRKPSTAEGTGPDGSPGIYARADITVYNAQGRNVSVLAFFQQGNAWVRSRMSGYMTPDGYLLAQRNVTVAGEVGALGEVNLFLPYQAIDPGKLGKKVKMDVVVSYSGLDLGDSEFVDVKLPKPDKIGNPRAQH